MKKTHISGVKYFMFSLFVRSLISIISGMAEQTGQIFLPKSYILKICNCFSQKISTSPSNKKLYIISGCLAPRLLVKIENKCFCLIFLFLHQNGAKKRKTYKKSKMPISTSKHSAEHPFAGQNIQHMCPRLP